MKRLLVLLPILALFGLAACDNPTTPGEGGGGQTETPAQSTPTQ